jgi:hypothetical protein
VDGNGRVDALTDGLMLLRGDVRTDRLGMTEGALGGALPFAKLLGQDPAVSETAIAAPIFAPQ